MSSDWWGIVWLFVLLAGNAFFVGAEFAVLAARRSQIEPLAEAGNAAAKTALWAMENATLMLASCQLGITVCSLLILNVSEPAIHHLLQVPLEALGAPEQLTSVLSFVVALALVTFLHVTLGEMVPKNVSFSLPTRSVLLLAPPLVFLSRLSAPLIRVLDGTANAILRAFGVQPKREATSTYTLDQVATIVAESKREGMLQDDSGTLAKAFEFSAKHAADLAVPMEQLVTLPLTVTPRELELAVAREGFSRYVLTTADGSLAGYLHFKDAFSSAGAAFDQPVPASRVRRLARVRGGDDVEDALGLMRNSGRHVAEVEGDDGRVLGVLFLEDIIEELIGEVDDATRRLADPARAVAPKPAPGPAASGAQGPIGEPG